MATEFTKEILQKALKAYCLDCYGECAECEAGYNAPGDTDISDRFLNGLYDLIKKKMTMVNWCKITAHILNETTGEIKISEHDAIYDRDTDGPSLFIWEEGNFSCDCNRSLFFDGKTHACGDEKFKVNIYNLKESLIYQEF